MLRSFQHAHETLPKEYRTTVGNLFLSEDGSGAGNLSMEIIVSFADLLGIGSDFRGVIKNIEADMPVKKLLGHFQNNLDLLIQKTWVEKDDEIRKEKLQDKIPKFVAGIEAGKYEESLAAFGCILEELAYLFFGAQSKKADFIEYVFRIDEQMGLFWWYGENISLLADIQDIAYLRAALFIGICYLTNF